MKLTGQADFFIKQYGADKGIEKLKKLGQFLVPKW